MKSIIILLTWNSQMFWVFRTGEKQWEIKVSELTQERETGVKKWQKILTL